MGQRSDYASLAVILLAFKERRRWTQTALAERADISVPAVRRRLQELESAGMPLSIEDDPPHKVWTVPEGWMLGSVYFDAVQSAELLRVMVQAPRSSARDRLIARVANCLPDNERTRMLPRVVEVPALDLAEEQALATLQLAVGSQSVRMQWYSERRGELEWREMSPQRIVVVPTPRVVGLCHRDDTLKWFKASNMTRVEARPSAQFRASTPNRVDAFIQNSIHGFHGETVEECVFRVRDAEWRWIRNQLRLHALRTEEAAPGWRRVFVRTSGAAVLARFLVGYGDAIRPESRELRARMRDLIATATQAMADDAGVT